MSAQAALCIVPGCCAQVALCKLLHAQLRLSILRTDTRASCGEKLAQRAQNSLKTDVEPLAVEVLCALYVCASGLRFFGRSRQEYTPHTTASLLEPELPRTRGNRPRDRVIAKAGAQTTRQLPKAISRVKHRTAPQRERFDTHDLRRGFAETKTNSHGATARARRHARSPQMVHPRPAKTQKTSSFCTSTTPIRAEGCAGTARIAKNLAFLYLHHAGLRRRLHDRKKPRVFAPRPRRSPQSTSKTQKKKNEFFHLNHADPRRGLRGQIRHRKKTSSFCTSTTPIPAEVRAGTARIAKNLEFLHLDHADPFRGSQTRSTIKVLPRRPRKLNWLYALGSMHLALCTWLYALGFMHSALCTRLYALGSMHLALCTWLYALGSMHLALCTWLNALGSMHLAPCTWLYALGSMHSALCCALGSMHLALFALDSAQVTLCKLV